STDSDDLLREVMRTGVNLGVRRYIGWGSGTDATLRCEAASRRSRGGALEGADQALNPFVVGLERVLADDRLAFRVVQLQVDPVHAAVLAFQVCLTDELAAQAGARCLRRHVLGLLDRLVVGDTVDLGIERRPVVDALLGPDVMVL